MALRSMYQTLSSPLNPRVETWVRRALGVGQAILAILAGSRAVQLTVFLSGQHRMTGGQPADPHGFGLAALMFLLVPSTVLLGFGAISVWRKWAVPPVFPLATLVALEVMVRAVM